MGAKSEAGSEMYLALMSGAPVLVTYQRSEAAVMSETCCISGSKSEMMCEGSILREMQGPDRGLRRRMMRSEQMCEGVCPEMDGARGCVSQSPVAACALRDLVTGQQCLHPDSGQRR